VSGGKNRLCVVEKFADFVCQQKLSNKKDFQTRLKTRRHIGYNQAQ